MLRVDSAVFGDMIYGVWRDIYNVKIPAPSIGADFELCDGDDPDTKSPACRTKWRRSLNWRWRI